MRFLRFAARDLVVGAVTAGAWALEARARGSKRFEARAVAVGAGLLTGLVGFAAHEWGHLAGSIATGGVVHEPDALTSPFLFFFDVEASSRRAFLGMSYGGYAGTVLASLVILRFVPPKTLAGKVALAATTAGVLATFALEIPTTVRVARGGPLPKGGVYRGDPDRAG